MANPAFIASLINSIAPLYNEIKAEGFLATVEKDLPATAKFLQELVAVVESQPAHQIEAELAQAFGDFPAAEVEITKLFGSK